MCSLETNLRPIVRKKKGERTFGWCSLNWKSLHWWRRLSSQSVLWIYQNNVLNKAELEHLTVVLLRRIKCGGRQSRNFPFLAQYYQILLWASASRYKLVCAKRLPHPFQALETNVHVCVFKNILSSSHMWNPEKLHVMCGFNSGKIYPPERQKCDVLNLSKKEEK